MTDSRDWVPRAADPFARQLLSRYLERRRSDITALSQALSAEDFDAIRLAGHKMYGSGAAYGFQEITDLGRRLEMAAKSRQPEAIAGLIDDLEGMIGRLGA